MPSTGAIQVLYYIRHTCYTSATAAAGRWFREKIEGVGVNVFDSGTSFAVHVLYECIIYHTCVHQYAPPGTSSSFPPACTVAEYRPVHIAVTHCVGKPLVNDVSPRTTSLCYTRFDGTRGPDDDDDDVAADPRVGRGSREFCSARAHPCSISTRRRLATRRQRAHNNIIVLLLQLWFSTRSKNRETESD